LEERGEFNSGWRPILEDILDLSDSSEGSDPEESTNMYAPGCEAVRLKEAQPRLYQHEEG
jgi:hypothetical protein